MNWTDYIKSQEDYIEFVESGMGWELLPDLPLSWEDCVKELEMKEDKEGEDNGFIKAQINVELIDKMGDDLRVSNVARVSFGKWKGEIDEKDVKLINYLAKHEHNSPFRHVQISVRCKAPVFLARQLVKHQVGLSWNEISRRYVDNDFEFYVPKEWRKRPEGGIKQGSGGVIDEGDSFFSPHERVKNKYKYLIKEALDVYEDMLEQGVAPEMARMVLPQSMMVDWVWTGSLEAFYHVYRLRSGEGAQEEAKEFAEKLKQVVQPLFPNAWNALVGE